ncbi:MAG: DUF5685 family protein [Oscillospiraceae bacterium]|nr:DUF5685 family protein [Oscillospiraceae bacterium]
MFGYILVNPKTLSKAEKARYRAAYCGMCRQLDAYGAAGRAALSYDMTFIALLLNSVYKLDEEHGEERCVMRPVPVHKYFISEATAYAADMNILFAYYNELDDWNDEGDRHALERSAKLGEFLPALEARWPAQVRRAAECVDRLSAMERENVLNPDGPANCFGDLMGEVLDWRGEGGGSVGGDSTDGGERDNTGSGAESGASGGVGGGTVDSAGGRLRRMGEALGRFLYLLDASNDLREDIRKERYNPLVSQMDTDFEPLLTMLIGECTGEFEQLNPERDVHLLRNVLYSGVWMRYRKTRGASGGKGADNG